MRSKENIIHISGRTAAPAIEHYAGDPATLFTGSPNVPILRDRATGAIESHEIHRPTPTHARRRTTKFRQ
jgi:hypothetical protein